MRKLLAATGILTIALSMFYVARPAGHVPLFDAALNRLIESPLEGYCSARTFWSSQGLGNEQEVEACLTENAEKYGTGPSPLAAVRSWCRVIIDMGWQGTVDGCVDVMRSTLYYPTYDGALSDQWNRVHPHPLQGVIVAEPPDDSRTGRRQTFDRDPPSRDQDVPTIQQTEESPEPEESPEASPSPEGEDE